VTACPRPVLEFSVIQGNTGIPRIGTVFAFFLKNTAVDKSIITFHAAIGMNMPVSPHQINNVLRVYGDQLCQSRISDRPEIIDANDPEGISISLKTIQKTIIDGITSNIIERITQSGPLDTDEKAAVKKMDNEHENPLATNEDHRNNLIFKEIDGNAESIHSLSIEASKFLTNKLMVTIKETGKKI
jgi:hypothetical protein